MKSALRGAQRVTFPDQRMFDEIDHIDRPLELFSCGVGNLDSKLLFKRHHEFNGVETHLRNVVNASPPLKRSLPPKNSLPTLTGLL